MVLVILYNTYINNVTKNQQFVILLYKPYDEFIQGHNYVGRKKYQLKIKIKNL